MQHHRAGAVSAQVFIRTVKYLQCFFVVILAFLFGSKQPGFDLFQSAFSASPFFVPIIDQIMRWCED